MKRLSELNVDDFFVVKETNYKIVGFISIGSENKLVCAENQNTDEIVMFLSHKLVSLNNLTFE